MKNHQKEKIVDLIEYKEEKANSRFILKGIETGMLLVALKKGNTLPEHVSSRDAVICVLEGEVDFIINIKGEKKPFLLCRGEIFPFQANEKHEVLAKEDSKLMIIKI